LSFKWTWENEVKTQIFDSELVWTRNCFELLLLPTKHLNLNLLNIFCYVCRDGNADSTSSPLPNFFTLFLPSFTWDGCSVCLPFLSPPSLPFFLHLLVSSECSVHLFFPFQTFAPSLPVCLPAPIQEVQPLSRLLTIYLVFLSLCYSFCFVCSSPLFLLFYF